MPSIVAKGAVNMRHSYPLENVSLGVLASSNPRSVITLCNINPKDTTNSNLNEKVSLL